MYPLKLTFKNLLILKLNVMKNLRIISILEGSSLLLLLLIAVPLKRLMGLPEAVSIIGPIHGGLFILFNIVLIIAVLKWNLKVKHAIIGFVASLIPFGSYLFKAKILKQYDR
jgi:integral membrane protein